MTAIRKMVSPTEGWYQRQRREKIVFSGILTAFWVKEQTPSIQSTTLRVWVLTTTAGIKLYMSSQVFSILSWWADQQTAVLEAYTYSLNHRNPDGDSKPWCFVRSGSRIKWDHCDVRKCPTGNYVSPFIHFHATRLSNSTDTCLAILNEKSEDVSPLSQGV